MPPKVNITADKVELSGALVVNTVTTLFDTTKLPKSSPLTLNLAGVDEIDSAGLSLLLYWLKRKPENQEIVFEQLPKALSHMIELCQLEPLFIQHG